MFEKGTCNLYYINFVGYRVCELTENSFILYREVCLYDEICVHFCGFIGSLPVKHFHKLVCFINYSRLLMLLSSTMSEMFYCEPTNFCDFHEYCTYVKLGFLLT